jgi:hypothetical protein
MNFEIFKSPDPSGRLSKESFISNNYPEEYIYIIDFCSKNGMNDLPFKEKVYLSVNKINRLPVCKNPNCSSLVSFRNSTLGYREYCSTKCLSSDPDIKKIKQQKSIQKYGTNTPAQSQVIKNKIIKTNLEKWGANSPMCDDGVRKKSKETLIKNWGVDNPSKSEELIEKRIESFKLSDFKQNFKKTSIEKYGVEHPWMNEDIHNKTIDFFYQNYRQRIESKIDGDYKFVGFAKGTSTYLNFYCKKCESDFDILTYQFYYRINSKISICTKCFPISESSSVSQIELYNFIKENYDGEILLNTKDFINPYEIDIYLPELNIGFEFNGVWWHSNKFKKQNYHQSKIQIAEDKGIKLVMIWEDDWQIKREICKSFILNKLGKTKSRIFARKCLIQEVNYMESKKFLDENHLQGDCKSSIRIGLFFNDEIVSLMTFSKLRLPLQRFEKNRNRKDHFELTRFCNRIDSNVIGGASKMIKYFIEKNNPKQIETYSDNLISSGHLYEKIGFEYTHTSNPGYWYVVNGIRQHRFNWRKQKLIKMGHDPSKSEEEIMNELGYWRIYNAGNKKWILNLEK